MKSIFYAMLVIFSATRIAQTAAAETCGTVPTTGSCSGSVLSYCQDPGTSIETLVQVDCSSEVFPADISGQCVQINADYGYDCAVPEGERCIFQDDQNNVVTTFCAGTNPGCIIDENSNSSACRNNMQVCTMAAAGQTFSPVCDGDVLVTRCHEGQPVGIDCAASLGHCNAGRCTSLPAGENCDAVHLCAAGLECDALTETCIDPAQRCNPSTDSNVCNDAESSPILRYCDANTGLWTEQDCSQAIDNGIDMGCGPAYNCTDNDGNDCSSEVGASCTGSYEGSSCDVAQGLFCEAGLGCVSHYNGSFFDQCQPTGECSFGDSNIGCVNNVATYCIADAQHAVVEAAGFDCSNLASQCQIDASNGEPVCIGDIWAVCDDLSLHPDSPFRCAAGLVCHRELGDALGHCEEPETDGGLLDATETDATETDAGPALDDAGTAMDANQADSTVADSAVRADATVAADAADEPDASVSQNDAGGAQSAQDAGGNTGAANGGGCGCQTSQTSHSLGLLMLFGFAFALRRRRQA